MFEFQGIAFPDGEKHFPEWMARNGEKVDGRGTYQIKKLRAAVERCKNFRNAVDVGGHVGLWAMHLAKRFQQVHAFEPVAQMRECFARNVNEPNVLLYAMALGAERGMARIAYEPADSGGTHVAADGVEVAVRTLDEFDLQDVDFIKIDCEGYEIEVLKGARETLERCRPCVIVEQKARCLRDNYGIAGRPAVDFLTAMGAKLRREIDEDFILSWD